MFPIPSLLKKLVVMNWFMIPSGIQNSCEEIRCGFKLYDPTSHGSQLLPGEPVTVFDTFHSCIIPLLYATCA